MVDEKNPANEDDKNRTDCKNENDVQEENNSAPKGSGKDQFEKAVESVAKSLFSFGKKAKETLEKKLASEKTKIESAEGGAAPEQVVGHYTKKAESTFKSIKTSPLGALGKAMIKGGAKATGTVAKISGRTIKRKVEKAVDNVGEAMKTKPGEYLERELAKKELESMTNLEKFVLASMYGTTKKIGIAAEEGKKLAAKGMQWVKEKLLNKTYKAYLPGAEILVGKVLQYAASESDNMMLDGTEGEIKYEVSAKTSKKASSKIKTFTVSTNYEGKIDGKVPYQKELEIRVSYGALDKGKAAEITKKELDALVQQAIRDIDLTFPVDSMKNEGPLSLAVEGLEAPRAYTYSVEKQVDQDAARNYFKLSLLYEPENKADPALEIYLQHQPIAAAGKETPEQQ